MVESTCQVKGCARPVYVKKRGWCAVHYNRWSSTGDPGADIPCATNVPRPEACDVAGCTRRVHARRLCKGHYCRVARCGDAMADVPIAARRRRGPACSAEGCDRKVRAHGLCATHYAFERYQQNPHAALAPVRKRRARIKGASLIPFTGDQLGQRLSMFAGCWMCGGPKEEVDHVKPISKGGPHCLANLRPACRRCNARKSDTWPWERQV